ncbi:MAG TPA: FKBP-type peptidyl-prolyl cis-trans isomerase [Saprospiraceae bacterium]|nr:FKBP-type peptidyl-prolyl cis-trans isomerase [Saprospiraceae bacterium]
MKKSLSILAVICFFISCKNSDKGTSLNGLQYEILKDIESPAIQEKDYIDLSIQVKVGDSIFSPLTRSKLQATKIEVNKKTIQPIMELLYKMSEGDSARIFSPLTEIETKVFNVPAKSNYEYTVVVHKVKNYLQAMGEEAQKSNFPEAEALSDPNADKKRAATSEAWMKVKPVLDEYNSKSLNSSWKKTKSGIDYIIHQEGSGNNAKPGNTVSVHYLGTLLDGIRFDDSWSRGSAFDFKLGDRIVIDGWEEALQLLSKGSRATFVIPAQLAYGEKGNPPIIPGNSTLMFYIELIDIK